MHPLSKIVVATSLVLAQMTMSPVMAAQNPGDSCSPDGSVAAFSGTSMTCQQSKWVLDGPMPQPEASGTQQPAASTSTVKKAKISEPSARYSATQHSDQPRSRLRTRQRCAYQMVGSSYLLSSTRRTPFPAHLAPRPLHGRADPSWPTYDLRYLALLLVSRA